MLVWDGNSWGDEDKRPQRDGSGRLASLLEFRLVVRESMLLRMSEASTVDMCLRLVLHGAILLSRLSD